MSSLEEPELQAIGQGSFGKVWLLTQTPYAFKTVLNPGSGADLENEWATIVGVYATCNSTSFFAVPRPLAVFLPHSTDSVQFAPPNLGPNLAQVRRRAHVQLPQSIFHENGFTAATYAMTFIRNVPPLIAQFVAQNFYSEKAQAARPKIPNPNLLRVYLGRDGPERLTSRFVNSKNFAVNVTQYTRLAEVFGLPAPGEVSQGMGEMIGKLHWLQGCDARDVEFVIGDTGFGSVEYWLLDFNQARKFDREAGDIDELVQAHFYNDPYFPLARAADPLFAAFQLGYKVVLESCSRDIQARGEQFLVKLMEKQAERDKAQADKEAAGAEALKR
ncbi:hypothetical protein MKEN_01232000 [Mycena kentingensis (nom. inval.)]|nr:hypothetical protein MKEN_01232000 [Mycena kentingensis (nom. inval.)]